MHYAYIRTYMAMDNSNHNSKHFRLAVNRSRASQLFAYLNLNILLFYLFVDSVKTKTPNKCDIQKTTELNIK